MHKRTQSRTEDKTKRQPKSWNSGNMDEEEEGKNENENKIFW